MGKEEVELKFPTKLSMRKREKIRSLFAEHKERNIKNLLHHCLAYHVAHNKHLNLFKGKIHDVRLLGVAEF